MKVTFSKGYALFESRNPGPLYVAPHAGLSYEHPTEYQDEGTHYIAVQAAKKGGAAIVSFLSRERDIGIDYYRQEPTKEIALEQYPLLRQGAKRKTRKFRKAYAWAAADDATHYEKAVLFNDFWRTIKDSNKPILFIHRQFLNPMRHPSILDIVAFNRKENVRKAVDELNKRYTKVFIHMLPKYKETFYFKNNKLLYQKALQKDTRIKFFNKVERNIEKRTSRFERKMEKMPFIGVTFQRNFKGESIKPLIERDFHDYKEPIAQLEFSEFLSVHFPDVAVRLAVDFAELVQK